MSYIRTVEEGINKHNMNQYKTLKKFMIEHAAKDGRYGTQHYDFGELVEVPNDKNTSTVFIVLPLWRGGNDFEVSHLRKGLK